MLLNEEQTGHLSLIATAHPSTSIPVKKFQSFLGKLFHATKCTTGARVFVSRLLNALATEHAGTISLNPAAKVDLSWPIQFLGQFHGVTLFKPSVAQHVIHVDSCLWTLGGGLCSGLSSTRTTSRTSASPSPAWNAGTSLWPHDFGFLPSTDPQSSSSVTTGPQLPPSTWAEPWNPSSEAPSGSCGG